MSNRVEELESQVAELQAAVDGLTEELVETRERLRQLESDDGVEHTRAPERREPADEATDDVDATADPAGDDDDPALDADEVADADEDESSDSDGNDIIVA
jgi:peptidoglycan hydrolase CwlO-like protein